MKYVKNLKNYYYYYWRKPVRSLNNTKFKFTIFSHSISVFFISYNLSAAVRNIILVSWYIHISYCKRIFLLFFRFFYAFGSYLYRARNGMCSSIFYCLLVVSIRYWAMMMCFLWFFNFILFFKKFINLISFLEEKSKFENSKTEISSREWRSEMEKTYIFDNSVRYEFYSGLRFIFMKHQTRLTLFL